MNTTKNLKSYYNKKDSYRLDINTDSIHQKVINYAKEFKNILDVGCAGGYIGEQLKKAGCYVVGVDISTSEAKKASKLLDKVLVANIEEDKLKLPARSFDCILFLDVLEHLFDPQEALTNMKKFLKPNGIVIVSIPNIAFWEVRKNIFLGNFAYTETGILDKGHIRFFTYQSSRKLFINSGFRIDYEDVVMKYPPIISKFVNKFPALGKNRFFEKQTKELFGFQFLFILKTN